jgi:hypothetical protein
MADDTSNLTPAQLADLLSKGTYAGIPLTPMGATPRAAATPAAGAAPVVSGLPSVNAEAMPSTGGLPNLRAPTPKESIAAGMAEHGTNAKQEGKEQYNELKPAVTAKPFTPEYYQQKQELADFQKLHPMGGDISEKPGVLGKIEHGLSRVGNIAGDVLAPGIMANIPGSDVYKRGQETERLKGFGEAEEAKQKEAAGEAATAGAQLTDVTDPNTGQTFQVPAKSLGQVESAISRGAASTQNAETRAASNETIATGKNQTAETIATGKSKDQLLKLGFDEHGAPLPDSQLSSQQRAVRDVTVAHTKLQQAEANLANAKADPNSPLGKALAAERSLRTAELQQKLEDHELVKPSGQAQSRGSAAEAALKLLPGLEDTVKQNAKDFGPIMGRIAKGDIKIGTVSPEIQKAYAQLESFYALQPSVHGFRNAEFVKDFDTFVGNLATNPDAVIAGLEGLKPTLKEVADEGVTYHRRIVENAQNAATAAPPATGGGAAAPVPTFGQWQQSQKNP